jgi:hypothetical protein
MMGNFNFLPIFGKSIKVLELLRLPIVISPIASQRLSIVIWIKRPNYNIRSYEETEEFIG